MIIAHRGRLEVDQKTENTIEDFEKAIKTGVHGIETDLRKTKCNTIVIYHDNNIQGQLIENLYFHEIVKMNPNIPSLICFMDLIEKYSDDWKGIVNLEIKTFGQTELIEQTLKYYPKILNRILITSFLHQAVWDVKKRLPQVLTGIVFRCFPTSFSSYIYTRRKPNFLIFFKETILDNDAVQNLMKKCANNKIKILIYTIKDQSEHQLYKDFDGLIADCSKSLLSVNE